VKKYVGIELIKYPKLASKPTGGWPLDGSIISTDAGNGTIKAFVSENGVMRSVNFPHLRVRSTGVNTIASFDGVSLLGATYMIWQDVRYIVGEGALKIAEYNPEVFQDSSDRYGSEHHISMVILSMALLGINPKNKLTLIVPAPPGLLNAGLKAKIISSFMTGEYGGNDGKWSIQVDEEPRITYEIGKVVVLPEGIGSYSAFRWDQAGTVVPVIGADGHDVLGGWAQVIDLGYGTADSIKIVGGDLSPESLMQSTDEQGGLKFKVVRPILDEIKSRTSSKSITAPHIELWMREWIQSGFPGDFSVRIGQSSVNIGAAFYRLMEEYANWVDRDIIIPALNKGANSIIQAGGGWVICDLQISRKYKGKVEIVSPMNYKHTQPVRLWDMNAVGQLNFAAATIRQHRT